MTIPIAAALRDPQLFGAGLGDPRPWSVWSAVLKAAFIESMDEEERRAFEAVAGGRAPPEKKVRELIAIVGRGGGKSRMAAAIAAYSATCINHSAKLAKGETGMVLVLAASQDQARIVFDYAVGFLQASPILRSRINSLTTTEIRLAGNIVIAVHSNSFRTIRGRTLLATVFDECAMWRSDESSNPDTEVYTAVLPSLIRTQGILVVISTGYRRAGLLYNKWRDHFGSAADPGILVVQGGTTAFNPNFDKEAIEIGRRADPEKAAAEWDGGFRNDIADFISAEVVEKLVGPYDELPPLRGERYFAFTDPSGGVADSFTLAIAHRDRASNAIVIDKVCEEIPPGLSPEQVVAKYSGVLASYRVRQVSGDHYGGVWPREAFAKRHIQYAPSKSAKSELYVEMLPLLHSGSIVLPNNQRLINQLCGLERKTGRSGRDSIDHGPQPGCHDDVANTVAGAAYLVAHPGGGSGAGRY